MGKQKIDYEEWARGILLRGAKAYRKKFIKKVDILSGYDRQRILEEYDKIVDEIKFGNKYKVEAENLQKRLEYLRNLEDCNEEFEL